MPEEYKIYHTNEAIERRWQQLSYEAFYSQAGFVCCPTHPCSVFFEHHAETEVIMSFVSSLDFSGERFGEVWWSSLGLAGWLPACSGCHRCSSPFWKGASGTHRMPSVVLQELLGGSLV